MNLLAHIYLSKGINELMLGNFIGDAVKGKQYLAYPKDIQKGILLHRKIDFYTDNHLITTQCKQYFIKDYGLHAAIVVDILYDHFLASHWNLYHSTDLQTFAQKVYYYFEKKQWIMPQKIQNMLPYFIASDWLNLYTSLDGIIRVLNGMALRTSLPNKTEQAKIIITNNYLSLETNFKEFFSDLIENKAF